MEKEEGYVTKDTKGMEIKVSWDPQQKNLEDMEKVPILLKDSDLVLLVSGSPCVHSALITVHVQMQ